MSGEAQAARERIVESLVPRLVSWTMTWRLMHVYDPSRVQLGLDLVQACSGNSFSGYHEIRTLSVIDDPVGTQVFLVKDMAGRTLTLAAAEA